MGGAARGLLRRGHLGAFFLGLCACGGAPGSDAPVIGAPAATATITSSSPSAEPLPPSNGALDFVFLVPAQDAVLIAGRVIAIDDDFNSLSGY